MKKKEFIKILSEPSLIIPIQTREVKLIVDEHPFFQPARAIYLKSLKDLQSFRFNHELRKTAAYTTNREILFNFITSKKFTKREVIKKVLHPNISKAETTNLTTKDDNTKKSKKNVIEESLSKKTPLSLEKNETHSFNKWVQLSKKQSTKPKHKTLTKQDSIIDKFIITNPKISKLDKNKIIEINKINTKEIPQLMTETLAEIYLEQKKYNSAIKAYEILSLKYPEKSGFFADQIKQIRILQKTK